MEFLKVLGLVTLPIAGNYFGGLLAEFFNVSNRTLSFALHAAAGILIAVIGIELMPEALSAERPWIPILALVAGGTFFIVVDRFIDVAQARIGGGKAQSSAWAIFFGVAVDLFADGVMIGAGSTITFSLGLLLALGQMPADVPEGFATIANFKKQGISRKWRILLSAAFAIPLLLGATIGYWAVRDAPAIVKLSLLAFVAGILLTVTIEEMVPESHREDDARLAAIFLVGGFALFALITSYFG